MAEVKDHSMDDSWALYSVAVDPAYQSQDSAGHGRDIDVGSIRIDYNGASKEAVTLTESNDPEKCMDFDSLHTKLKETSNIITNIPDSIPEKHNDPASQAAADEISSSQTPEYLGTLALSLLTGGICLSVFLVSLDRTIIAQVSKLLNRIIAMRQCLILNH